MFMIIVLEAVSYQMISSPFCKNLVHVHPVIGLDFSSSREFSEMCQAES